MPVAYLPSPASSVWHVGAIAVRAYALCMVVGVVAALWLTDRRYRKATGQRGVILDLATVAVPVGFVGARIYSVLADFDLYFGPGRDWTDVLRVWRGGMGVAGAVAAGALAAWVYCRRTGIKVGPVALAAAPALAVAQAISVWGNWFSQTLYGQPSGLPWAVAIAPQHRVAGYQAVAAFQPLFLYQSALDLLIAAGLSYGIHRYTLSGGRAFALYGASWAAAGAAIEVRRLDYSPVLFGLRSNLIGTLVIGVLAVGYLATAHQRSRQRASRRATAEPPPRQQMLRPRSSRATAGRIGLTGPDDSSGEAESPQLQP
jgi:prolipoprotein diacylglyceryl transferase